MDSAIAHVSTEPWSNWTAADYSVEQWHNACLIHQHTGAPTSKGECKLPVKTPQGTVNKNGVHAAAAALAGARGGVNATPEQIASAKSKLRGLYSTLGEEAPPSLKQDDMDPLDAILEHHGIKGMKWGVRRARSVLRKARPEKQGPSEEAVRAKELGKTAKRSGTQALSNKELQDLVTRMNLEQQYSRLQGPSKAQKTVGVGARFASGVVKNVATTQASALGNAVVQQQLNKALSGSGIELGKKKK